MVFTINLKFFVRYIGVFGFPNCQKSAKFGPIYFNKNWSAEKCPLNWSCPLFLESAKLEFHCIYHLFLKDMMCTWYYDSYARCVSGGRS